MWYSLKILILRFFTEHCFVASMLSSLNHGAMISRRRRALVVNLDMAPPTKETLEKEEDYTTSLVHIHVCFLVVL